MNLKEYLAIRGLTISEFAKLTDFSRQFISGVIHGKIKARAKTARLLSKYTRGAVTENEILRPFKENFERETNEKKLSEKNEKNN